MTEQKEPCPEGAISIREHFDALLDEFRRAAATAEQEREKAAAALRDALAARIASGDKQLQVHIDAQIESVRLALVAAKELSDQRQEAAEGAVDKAFAASTELAHKHNDLIAQADRDKEKFATKVDLGYFREKLDDATEARERLNESVLGKVGRVEYEKAEDEWGAIQRVVDERLNDLSASMRQQEAVNKTLTEYQRERKEYAGVTVGQAIAVVAVLVTIVAILVGAYP